MACQIFFETQDLRCSNAFLKELEKAFCLQLFSIQGRAQDRCVNGKLKSLITFFFFQIKLSSTKIHSKTEIAT